MFVVKQEVPRIPTIPPIRIIPIHTGKPVLFAVIKELPHPIPILMLAITLAILVDTRDP